MIMQTASEDNSDFVDVTPASDFVDVMDNVVDPEVAGLDDDNEENVHDQLPSVEEAKANADLEKGSSGNTKSLCRYCCYICCCLCTSFVLVIILGIVITAMSESGGGSVSMPHSDTTIIDDQQKSVMPETLAPGIYDSRFHYVRDYLTAFSNAEDLDRHGSPQRQAARWISDQDLLHLDMDHSTFLERYALAALFFATDGPNWEMNLGFLTERDICDWFHVGFGADDKPRHVGANCQGGKKVKQLFFPEKWLTGQFPPEMKLLDHLRYISTYRNPGLKGELPEAFRKLTNLEYLAMHFCELEKSLPTWLGEMTALTSLILSNNKLTGRVPTSIAELTKLNQLFLDDNELKGDIKILAPLKSLKALLLEDNHMHGSLRHSMIVGWQHMEIMDLSNNNLTSSIPINLWEMKNLSVLDLHANQLTHKIPHVNQSNTALRFVALNDNNLSGDIPMSINRLHKLSHLDLATNLLTGNLPHQMEDLTNLKYLFLSMNAFKDASIPTFLQSLTKLEDLSLKATGRNGIIPHWLGEISSLVLLDLDTNELTGTIPRSIGDMGNLKFLLLNRNQLTGTIPNSIEKMTNLDFLMLERNSLNGTAHHVCVRDDKPQVFMADCAEIECECCTACCRDSENSEQCDDLVWLGGVDPIWETKYERTFYKFEKVKLRQEVGN